MTRTSAPGALRTPALLLDLDKLERNLERMAARAEGLGVRLRPHVKTHKCVEIARLQTALGARGLTVSTLHEARVFAAAGFDDITWAFPVILNRIDEARDLAERVTLRLVVDSPEAVRALEATGFAFHVWLKVDCGYHRAGVDPEGAIAVELARRVDGSATLVFDGLLTHSGDAYHAGSPAELAIVAERERAVMAGLAGRLRSAGVAVPEVSVGSTPAMSAVRDLTGVTEARPGNYAFYDFTQTVLGSCAVQDCALTVLASVVSSRPGGGQSVIDAGALALSRDPGPEGAATMGEIYDDYDRGTLSDTLRVRSVSQEHGIVSGELPVGSLVRILPNHSCLTAACFDEYLVCRGREAIASWRIDRGR